jgi:hypothetical protein
MRTRTLDLAAFSGHSLEPWHTNRPTEGDTAIVSGHFPNARTVALTFAIDAEDDANVRLLLATPALLAYARDLENALRATVAVLRELGTQDLTIADEAGNCYDVMRQQADDLTALLGDESGS